MRAWRIVTTLSWTWSHGRCIMLPRSGETLLAMFSFIIKKKWKGDILIYTVHCTMTLNMFCINNVFSKIRVNKAYKDLWPPRVKILTPDYTKISPGGSVLPWKFSSHTLCPSYFADPWSSFVFWFRCYQLWEVFPDLPNMDPVYSYVLP